MIFTNLLTNMVVLTLHSTIPTNTPEFQEYAFREMFNSASNMVSCWQTDFPKPIRTNMVTDFHAAAYPSGIGGIMTFSNRFQFSWLYGGLPNFDDDQYIVTKALTPYAETNDAIFERWMHATNLLTIDMAQKLAESAMTTVGLPVLNMGFSEPKQKRQRHYTWTDGKTYPLPYYEFVWESDNYYCNIHISGISGKIVHFHFTGYPYLRFQKPENYFEMLHLPTNTVFVHQYPTAPGTMPVYELREK